MLPQGTEPLVLADGTKINPIDGLVIHDTSLVEVPNTEQIKREIVASRKRISDLPVPPGQMNTISVIISYTLFGINDEDISLTLFIPLEQVIQIKKSDSYKNLQEQFIKNILESDLSSVRSMFIQKSKTAADKMFSLLNSDSEATQITAAKDVLDRAGHRPVDVIEHRHKMEGGLTIEYVEKKDDVPMIDVTPKEM
ncbi:hypothetical protein LCGC14_1528800 [marine sediment metagenome]|uniref:Uncharacterized protein n=1 Tax=marine sediment metagenome TaxID=412755 RepID=A0A0F9JH87_9ZZZZ